MSYPRQSFGGAGRTTSFVFGSGGVGGAVVQIGGPPGEELGSAGVVSVFRNSADDIDLTSQANFLGVLATVAGPQFADAGALDRALVGADNADDVAVRTTGFLATLARGTLFDGTTWDRARSASAAALAAFSSAGAALVSEPGNWSINHTPAAATQATITRAAGGASVRHVATSISAYLIIQPTINQPVITLNLRDGGTGAGTILWSRNIGVGAALANGGEQSVELSGLKIVGSANTAMTLEFSAAGAAGTIQSVALTGHDAS